ISSGGPGGGRASDPPDAAIQFFRLKAEATSLYSVLLDTTAGERVRVGGVCRVQIDLAPHQLQFGPDVVVVEADVDAHVAVGTLPRDDIDAQLRPPAPEVPAVVPSGALARFDDAIAQEHHVGLALAE